MRAFTTLLLVIQLSLSLAQLFSSNTDMEYLLETQRRFIEVLDAYVLREETRIKHLKRKVELQKMEHEVAIAHTPNYLGNPIIAFSLVNRLTNGLNDIAQAIYSNADGINNMSATAELPGAQDLRGAAAAVARVALVFNLNVTALAAGLNADGIPSIPMTAGECYELGVVLYQLAEYNYSLHWMFESLRRFEVEGNVDVEEVAIIEQIAYTYFVLEDHESAIKWTNIILEKDPNHPRASFRLEQFEDSLIEVKSAQLRVQDLETYGQMCRGELGVPEKVSKGLTCRYQTEGDPFLKLAPLKQEQLYRAPDVFLYHQVLSDHEIAQVQDIARPWLARSTTLDVINPNSENSTIVSDYRTGKVAFLSDQVAEIVHRISQRVAIMTGLDMASSEDLQVVDYGAGGHYGPHTDYAPNDYDKFELNGNRIATVLFYLTDVALGGATVFPELGLSVPPARGSALHWTNLNPAGEGDLASKHASCPVLSGAKWILTKWLHEAGQELIRPCGLQYQPLGNWWKNPGPVLKSSR